MEEVKNSYFEKKETVCPCCGFGFFREKYFSGSSRFIAKDLAPDLRRQYQPTKKYGYVYPLIYFIVVCPECFYADFPETFNIVNQEEKKIILKNQFLYLEKIKEILNIENIDFNEPRDLKMGIVSYFLTISYVNNRFHEKNQQGKSDILIKKAMSAIRSAWCLDDLMIADKENEDYWGSLKNYFYFLAYKVYDNIMEDMNQFNKSPSDKVQWFGPDLDFDFGVDGILYLSGYLGYTHYEYIEDKDLLKKKIIAYSKCFSHIFGKGKASMGKTRPLLLHAEEMYKKISEITKLFN